MRILAMVFAAALLGVTSLPAQQTIAVPRQLPTRERPTPIDVPAAAPVPAEPPSAIQRQPIAGQRTLSTGVSALAAKQTGLNTVDLRWSPTTLAGISYLVKGPGLAAAGVSTTANQYHVTNVPPGKQTYTVAAARGGLPLGTGTVQLDVSPIVMHAPNMLIREPDQTIDINFYNAGGVSHRLFKRAGPDAAFAEVTVKYWWPNTARYFDHNLTPGWTYYYRFLSKLADGSEVWSDIVPVPIPVMNLAPTVMSNPTRIHLAWNPFSQTPDYVIHKRSNLAPQFDLIRTASGDPMHITNGVTFDDTIVGSGQKYWYMVCGRTALGEACATSTDNGIPVP